MGAPATPALQRVDGAGMALRCGLAARVKSVAAPPPGALACVNPRQMRLGQRVVSASASPGNSSNEPEKQQQKAKAQEVSDSEQDGNQQPRPGPPGPLRRLMAFVMQPQAWLAKASSASPLAALVVRLGLILSAFFLVALGRASYLASTSPRGVPREVRGQHARMACVGGEALSCPFTSPHMTAPAHGTGLCKPCVGVCRCHA